MAAVAGLVSPGPRTLSIVYTAMHGVGAQLAQRVFTTAGFAPMLAVPAQERPDPDFPTVAFPNPEEPGALDLSIELAVSVHADLIIANDPDADRCAVAVPLPSGSWRMLRGDEVGVLLADALMRKGVTGTYATTIVSSSLLGRLAAARGVGYAETLTGFKWISRAAPDLVYGYEEALGYAVAPSLVRDKDGISAGLLVAELAASLRASGSSLLGRLDELAAEFGRYATDQLSMRVSDLDRDRGGDAAAACRAAGEPARPAGAGDRPAARRRCRPALLRRRPGRRAAVGHRTEAEGLPRGCRAVGFSAGRRRAAGRPQGASRRGAGALVRCAEHALQGSHAAAGR